MEELVACKKAVGKVVNGAPNVSFLVVYISVVEVSLGYATDWHFTSNPIGFA